jgi:hypothetical protein
VEPTWCSAEGNAYEIDADILSNCSKAKIGTTSGLRGGGLRKLRKPRQDSPAQCEKASAHSDESHVALGPPPIPVKPEAFVHSFEHHVNVREENLDCGSVGEIGDPHDGTTVMIRHIACRYTKEQTETLLDAMGFKDRYKWIYLPMNTRKSANLGYVFVNFHSPSDVEKCCALLDNQVFGTSRTAKRCKVTMAFLQGAKLPQKMRRKQVSDKTPDGKSSAVPTTSTQHDLVDTLNGKLPPQGTGKGKGSTTATTPF